MAVSIGLLVDFISLSGFFLVPRSEQGNSLFLWILAFIGIIYSIALVSFETRRRFHSIYFRDREQLSGQKVIEPFTRIEKGVASITFLAGIPLMLCYCIAVAYVATDPTSENYPGYNDSVTSFIILRGLITGLVFGFPLCMVADYASLNIYKSLSPTYNFKRFTFWD